MVGKMGAGRRLLEAFMGMILSLTCGFPDTRTLTWSMPKFVVVSGNARLPWANWGPTTRIRPARGMDRRGGLLNGGCGSEP